LFESLTAVVEQILRWRMLSLDYIHVGRLVVKDASALRRRLLDIAIVSAATLYHTARTSALINSAV